MNNYSKWISITLSLMFTLILGLNDGVLAHSDDEHSHHGHEHQQPELPKKESVEQLLNNLESKLDELATGLKQQDHDIVHNVSESIEQTLSQLAQAIPAENSRAQGSVSNMQRAIDALHHAADEGKDAAALQYLERLTSMQPLLASQIKEGK